MIYLRFVIGLVLFCCSSLIAQILSGMGCSFYVSGTDYLPMISEKVLDCLAGSLLVSAFFKNPKVKSSKL